MERPVCYGKVAIIIPVYNAATTVADTVASLQAIEVGWEHVEKVVLCDDASRDDSFEVLRSLQFDRCPFEVLRHDVNKGESAAYKTMLDTLAPPTEWFLILHADDLALANFICRNVEILGLCNEKVASVSSNYWTFGLRDETLACEESDVVLFSEGNQYNITQTATIGCWWHISGALINKKKWLEFGGRDPELPYSGDWDLILRWQLRGYTVGHSLIATTKYRQWSDSSISSSFYSDCRDIKERTRVALGLREVFYGRTARTVAFQIFCTAFRRGVRFLVMRRPVIAIFAWKVGALAFMTLINPLRSRRAHRTLRNET